MSNTTNLFIQRPALPATGYTALPNWLFECETLDIKARDLTVLNYIHTKCKNWKVRVSDVAKHCRMSKNTVYAALKVLQQHGFAHWERLSSGHVNWFIHVPDQPPAVKPHTKKPQSKKPDPNFEHVLTRNEEKPSIEKTTTAPPENLPVCKVIIEEPVVVVVTEEPVLPAEPITELPNITPDLTVLEVFNEKEKNIVSKELNKVTDLTAQAVILFTLKTAIANNTVKNSPIALARGLINKALDGVLVTQYAVAKMKAGQSTAIPMTQHTPHAIVEDNYRAERIAKIRNLAAKHPECVEVMKRKGAFTFPSEITYMYFPYDFRDAGLI